MLSYGTNGLEIRVGDGDRTTVRYYIEYIDNHGWTWNAYLGDLGGVWAGNATFLDSRDDAVAGVAAHYAARIGRTPRVAPATIWHRPGEVILAILTDPDAGHLCSVEDCRRPIVTVKAAWDHRITDPAFRPGPWQLGEDAFHAARHADGTPNHGDQPSLYAVSRCPKCQEYDTVVYTQEAHGDRITCSTPGCDRNDWYSIGD